MAIQRRRLTDLWVTGRTVTVDDGQGDPVVVWLQKLNTIEQGEAARAADAARARLLAVKAEHDSTEYQAVMGAVLDYGEDLDTIVEFLLIEDRARASRAAEAQLAEEEEWKTDNYLQGLRDAWEGELKDRWVTADPKESDPEANRVYVALTRFSEEMTATVESDLAPIRERLMETPLAELRAQMAERMLELDAGQAWLDEFYRQQLFYGTRDVDSHGERYFENRAEVSELSTATYRFLRTSFENLEVDVMEGKGSPAPQSSSPSSEQPSEEATEHSPGLVAVGR